MISKKEIENFIKRYCKETNTNGDGAEILTKGIKEIENFGIRQFLKEVLHNSSEIPTKKAYILVCFKKDNTNIDLDYYIYCGGFTKQSWDEFIEIEIEREKSLVWWLYTDDIKLNHIE